MSASRGRAQIGLCLQRMSAAPGFREKTSPFVVIGSVKPFASSIWFVFLLALIPVTNSVRPIISGDVASVSTAWIPTISFPSSLLSLRQSHYSVLLPLQQGGTPHSAQRVLLPTSRRIWHSGCIALRAQRKINDEDESSLREKRSAKPGTGKLDFKIPRDAFSDEVPTESTTAWDELSEVDGLFQTALKPLMRNSPGNRLGPGVSPSLPLAQEVNAVLRKLEIPLAGTALVGCGVLAGETLRLEHSQAKTLLDVAESAINTAFIAEYLLRWYSRNLRPSYLLKWEMVVDLVSFVPFVLDRLGLGQFSGLLFIRLLRVLRLQRYLRDVESFENIVGGGSGRPVKPYQLEVARVSCSLLTALFITAGLVYATESPYNPSLSNYFQTFYFSVTTLTTIGFGDITPITPAGKAVVVGAILVGVGVVPYQISKVAATLTAKPGRSVVCLRCAEASHPSHSNFCWRCGEPLPAREEATLRFRDDIDARAPPELPPEDSDDFYS